MAVKRYNGTSWDTVAGLGAQGAAATSSSITTWVKTASGGETSLTGSSDSSTTLAYTPGQEQVFINGVLQVRGSDYTATNGTSITGLTALVAGDIATVTTVNAFSVTGAVPLSTVTANGDLIVGTSSGAVGRLGIGSTSQVLTVSGGVPSWATPAAGGGGLVFISRTTFSGVATQAFDSIFTSTYQRYYVTLDNMTSAASADDLQLQFRYAGPTTEALSYYGATLQINYNGSGAVVSAQSGPTQFTISPEVGIPSNGQQGSGYLYFSNVGNSSQKPSLISSYNTGLNGTPIFGGTQQDTVRTYTGFLLKASSGNIAGTVTVYGLANS